MEVLVINGSNQPTQAVKAALLSAMDSMLTQSVPYLANPLRRKETIPTAKATEVAMDFTRGTWAHLQFQPNNRVHHVKLFPSDNLLNLMRPTKAAQLVDVLSRRSERVGFAALSARVLKSTYSLSPDTTQISTLLRNDASLQLRLRNPQHRQGFIDNKFTTHPQTHLTSHRIDTPHFDATYDLFHSHYIGVLLVYTS
jgi:hypothetical protein